MEDRIPKLIAGIDPGISGAIALIIAPSQSDLDFQLFDIIDMPLQENGKTGRKSINLESLAQTLSMVSRSIAFAALEHVHSMPGQGVASTFTFGRALGHLEGLIAASFIPFFPVSAQIWKRALRLGPDKGEAIALAIKLFPQETRRFSRKKDHNRAEATLLAVYGALHLSETFSALKSALPE